MDDQAVTGLPASIEAAWGLRRPSPTGHGPPSSLERIVAAAVQSRPPTAFRRCR